MEDCTRAAGIEGRSAFPREAAREIYSDDGFFVIPAETAGNFIIQNLAGLMKEYTVLGSDKLAGLFSALTRHTTIRR